MTLRQNPREIFGRALKELSLHKSPEKITVQDIATYSGYSRKNFYYYFQDKYDLMKWTFNHEGDKLVIENIDKPWADILTLFFRDVKKYRRYYSYLFSDEFPYPILNEYCDFIVFAMKTYIRHRNPDADISGEEFSFEFVAYASTRHAREWLKSGCKMAEEEITEKLVECYPKSIYRYFCSNCQRE